MEQCCDTHRPFCSCSDPAPSLCLSVPARKPAGWDWRWAAGRKVRGSPSIWGFNAIMQFLVWKSRKVFIYPIKTAESEICTESWLMKQRRSQEERLINGCRSYLIVVLLGGCSSHVGSFSRVINTCFLFFKVYICFIIKSGLILLPKRKYFEPKKILPAAYSVLQVSQF